MGFESRVERNDLAKDSSVMVLRFWGGNRLLDFANSSNSNVQQLMI